MFYRDPRNIYRARPLDQFPWLVHGFGTRRSPDLLRDPTLATLHQIHSDICVAARGQAGVLGEGDALVENTHGRLVGVKTADCLPVLMVDEKNRAVAAVHAGWRGTAAGVMRAAVRKMQEEFGSIPANLHAACGPSIGECCYEVGPEVAAHFGRTGRCRIDLARINRSQLLDAGIAASRIYLAGLCTMCGEEDFYSWRRDKERAGRMLSFAGIR